MGFKNARINASLTVKQVQERLGVSDATVYLWETGKMFPRVSRLIEIADLYGVTVEELLKDEK